MSDFKVIVDPVLGRPRAEYPGIKEIVGGGGGTTVTTSGSGTISIGDAVGSATNNRVLTIDGGGNLADDILTGQITTYYGIGVSNISSPSLSNLVFGFYDTTTLGGSETIGLLGQSTHPFVFSILDIDTLKTYFSVTKDSSDQASIDFNGTVNIDYTAHDVLFQLERDSTSYTSYVKFRTNNVTKWFFGQGQSTEDFELNSGSFKAFRANQSTGALTIAEAFTLPVTDGTASQVLKTDGAGAVTWGDTTSGYTLADGPDYQSSYVYVGLSNTDGSWYIYRRTLADNTRLYASGASGYATAWTNRTTQTYV